MDKFNLETFVSDFKNGIDNPHNIGWTIPCEYTFEYCDRDFRIDIHTDEDLTRFAHYYKNKLIWCGVFDTEVFVRLFNKNDNKTIVKPCDNQLEAFKEYAQNYEEWLREDLEKGHRIWQWKHSTTKNEYTYLVELRQVGFDIEIKASVLWGERLYKKTNFTADIETTQQRRTKEWFKDLIEYTLDQQETQFLL